MDYQNKSREGLIRELEDMRLELETLKSTYQTDISSRNQTEEKLVTKSDLLSSFNRYSIELSEQGNDSIQQFIVDSFKNLFKVRAVWLSRYDEKTSELVIETSTATGDESSMVYRYLGLQLNSYRTTVNEEKYNFMLESGTKIFTSLHEITFGQIPNIIGKAIEKFFDVGWFQGIALIDKGKLIGTLVVAGYKGQEELQDDILRIFAEITSNNLRRKDAESKLEASEDKFRNAFVTSPDSININRLEDGMYISINKGFTKISGYTEDDVIGRTSHEINIWADAREREKLVKGLRETGLVENLETSFKMKNGTIRNGIMSASIIELDGVKHILSITRDITERKIAEERLIKSEEKYRLLAENISDVIWILDAETMRFTYVSPSVVRLRGYTPEEVLAEPITHALSLEAAIGITSITNQRAKDLLSGKELPGTFYTNEVEQPCKDGSSVLTEVVTTFHINHESGRVEVLGVTRDITERKKAADALRQSEIYFSDVFESVNVGVAYTTLTGKFLAINKALEDLLGIPEEEVIGKTLIPIVRKFLTGKNLKTALRAITSILQKKKIKPVQIEFNDKILEVSVNSSRNSDRLTGVFRDVTERKKADEEIQKISKHYRALIEKATDGIILLDASGNIKFASPSARKIFGYGLKEKIPGNPATFTHPEDLPMVLSELGKLMGDPQYVPTIQYRFSDTKGNWLWVESTFSNFLDDPSVESIVINFRNITDRKLVEDEIKMLNVGLEERVNERTAQLEAANSELQAFAYSVSHDLRAPLRAIDGFSKFVLEDYGNKLDEEGQRLLGLIRSNTQKMDKLITDILALSRVTRGEHKKSKIDMTKMAVSMFNEAVSPEVQEKLIFTIEALPESYADSTYIKQVWINLISNAIKFSSLKVKPEIKIGGYTKNGSNVYYIKDNGVGFNPEYAHKLFGVFQRLHKVTEFEGTGVGLAIVQRIIHRHGGTVWAESKEGQGATFFFSLPVKK